MSRGRKFNYSKRAGSKPPQVSMATAVTITRPAPIGGWNARDPLAAMSPTDAIILDNFFPGTADVQLRAGKIVWATGLTGNCKTLLPYNSATVQTLFAATDSGVYNATASGAVGASVTTSTNGSWEKVNMTTSGGSFLVMVNGTDSLTEYDGTTWRIITGASVPAITGVTTSTLSNVTLFKRRLWFVQKNTMDVWYLPVDSIAGAATKFPLGPVFSKGGSLVAQASWTVDGGQGSDDLLITVTSEGEMAVYQGTDPTTSATFALVGVYQVGQPIGKRCLVKYGGDLIYLSQQGVFPLSKLLLSATIDRTQAISYKIEGAFQEATQNYSVLPGWQPIIFPNKNAILVNIPLSINSLSNLFVMNNITKAWCRFTGWNAACLEVFNNNLYSAVGSTVSLLWLGTNDSGAAITATAIQAYDSLGDGSQKYITLVRPNISLQGPATLLASIDTDFKTNTTSTSITYNPNNIPNLWDAGLWDSAQWTTALSQVPSNWTTVPNEPGYQHSFRLQLVTSTAAFAWTSNNYAFERAGIL